MAKSTKETRNTAETKGGSIDDFLELKKKVRPVYEALKIFAIYVIVGSLWIVLSDALVGRLLTNPHEIQIASMYKGWIYVTVTGVIFYLIISKRMQLFKAAIDKIFRGYQELSASHADLVSLENRLHTLAYYDTLTCLPNRTMLEETADKWINMAKSSHFKVALLYLDIDNFKHINDTMGHAAGDELICHIAGILSGQIRTPNLFARMGGDEFTILLVNINDVEDLIIQVDRIINSFKIPWVYKGNAFFVTVSMGVVIYPDHGTDLSSLMQNADTALFHVKGKSKDGYSLYTANMREKTWQHIQMNNQLIAAIKSEAFILHYQPQFDLTSGDMVGIEALIRWQHPVKGNIPPNDFIPFAEQNGLIGQIDKWVFKEVCRQKQCWDNMGYPPIKVAINLSGMRPIGPEVYTDIKQTLELYHINGCDVGSEITETAAMADLEQTVCILNKLKALGITVALDDFGTGYSSLTYLQRLPIDILKVDRSFIRHVVDANDEAYIFQSIIALAHHLGLKVIAEGVETKEQLAYIRKQGCDIVQGFYFSKPLPPDRIEAFLRQLGQEAG